MKKLLLLIGAVIALGACGPKDNHEPAPVQELTDEQKPFLADQRIWGVTKLSDENLSGPVRRVITKYSNDDTKREEQIFSEGYMTSKITYTNQRVEKEEYTFVSLPKVPRRLVGKIVRGGETLEFNYNEYGNITEMRSTVDERRSDKRSFRAFITYDFPSNMSFIRFRRYSDETRAMPFIQRDDSKQPILFYTYADNFELMSKLYTTFSMGRIVQMKRVSADYGYDEVELSNEIRSYDAKGLEEAVVVEFRTQEGLIPKTETLSFRYRNYTFDAHGNWTSRECEELIGSGQPKKYIQTREIVYMG